MDLGVFSSANWILTDNITIKFAFVTSARPWSWTVLGNIGEKKENQTPRCIFFRVPTNNWQFYKYGNTNWRGKRLMGDQRVIRYSNQWNFLEPVTWDTRWCCPRTTLRWREGGHPGRLGTLVCRIGPSGASPACPEISDKCMIGTPSLIRLKWVISTDYNTMSLSVV